MLTKTVNYTLTEIFSKHNLRRIPGKGLGGNKVNKTQTVERAWWFMFASLYVETF